MNTLHFESSYEAESKGVSVIDTQAQTVRKRVEHKGLRQWVYVGSHRIYATFPDKLVIYDTRTLEPLAKFPGNYWRFRACRSKAHTQ